MSNWITDRLPTEADADKFGDVWVTVRNGFVCEWNWRSIKPQMPWQPTNKPATYVKPKRWTVNMYQFEGADDWYVFRDGQIFHRLAVGLTYAAAQRICDIYNEEQP